MLALLSVFPWCVQGEVGTRIMLGLLRLGAPLLCLRELAAKPHDEEAQNQKKHEEELDVLHLPPVCVFR